MEHGKALDGGRFMTRDLELGATLGTGTFGRVRLALHKNSKAYYALKIMKKAEIIRKKQVAHIKSEVKILRKIAHPFIVNLQGFHQDSKRLYLLLEYVCGGELFSHMRNEIRLSEDAAKFYAAQLSLALGYLHSKAIVFRDIKPENILIASNGAVKLTDFGFAKVMKGERTFTMCGTPEYLAPEIIQSKGHSYGVDWWALGVLVFEMLAGYPPFADENPFGIYQKVLSGRLEYPEHFTAEARDIIRKLLRADTSKRLGCGERGVEEIKEHRWLGEADWAALLANTAPPPWIPPVSHDHDTCNFDEYPDSDGESTLQLSGRASTLFDDLKGF